MAAVNSIIEGYRSQHRGPVVLVMQCGGYRSSELASLMTSLGSMPIIKLTPIEKESDLPALTWLGQAAVIYMRRTLSLFKWWKSTVELARYAQVRKLFFFFFFFFTFYL